MDKHSRNRKRNTQRRPRSAGQWLLELRYSEVDTTWDAAFCEWLRQDKENERAFERCELSASLAQALRGNAQLRGDAKMGGDAKLREDFAECEALVDQWRARRASGHAAGRLQRLYPRLLMAASATAAAVLVVLGFILTVSSPTAYETRIGEQRSIVLEDASRVILNTDSRLSVSYTEDQRLLHVERGEAFFDVRPDKARPFIVRAGEGTVTAVGTGFNVLTNGAEITVSVLEGVVTVTPDKASSSIPIPANAPAPANAPLPVKELTVGEAVTYWSNGAVTEVVPADVKRIKAWQAGQLTFNQTPLDDVIAEHNRYSSHRIVVGNDSHLKNQFVTGTVKIGDTEALLFLLEKSLDLKVHRQAEVVVLTRNRAGLYRADARLE